MGFLSAGPSCGRGGIGRRSRFRSCHRKMWGFESLRPHQSRRSERGTAAKDFSSDFSRLKAGYADCRDVERGPEAHLHADHHAEGHRCQGRCRSEARRAAGEDARLPSRQGAREPGAQDARRGAGRRRAQQRDPGRRAVADRRQAAAPCDAALGRAQRRLRAGQGRGRHRRDGSAARRADPGDRRTEAGASDRARRR